MKSIRSKHGPAKETGKLGNKVEPVRTYLALEPSKLPGTGVKASQQQRLSRREMRKPPVDDYDAEGLK